MEIAFQNKKIQKICENTNYADRKLGSENARKLHSRLVDIRSAVSVAKLTRAGNPHALKGDRKGQYSISLAGGTRLVFKPNHDVVPRMSDGCIDWKAELHQ